MGTNCRTARFFGGEVSGCDRRLSMETKTMLKPTMIVLAAALALAACGRDTGGRALSGGLLGAGAGAGISALTGGNVGTGALIGGAVGAVGGAATSCRTINLGGRC